MTHQAFLQSVPSLAALDADQINTLYEHLEVASYEDGYVFVEEGITGDDAFIIFEGEVSVTRMKGKDKRIKELNRMSPREIFGIIALIDNKERTSTCRALGTVQVARLSRDAFSTIKRTFPDIGFQLQSIIARQMSRDHKFFSDEIMDVIFSGNAIEALKTKDDLIISDTYKGAERRQDLFTGFNGPERRT